MRFVDLTCSLEDVLETHGSIHVVKHFISRLLITPRQECCPSNSIVVDDPEEFGALGSISSVLSFLKEKRIVTFYNFKIFELFLEQWCAESNMTEEFQLYRKCLKRYAKRDIKESWLYCNEASQDNLAEGKQLVLETDETWNLHKPLQDVLSLEAEVAKILGIQEFALVLRRIECINECLKLHHYIPQVMVVTIQSGEAKKLINQGIVRVLCGGEDYNLNELCKFL